MNARDLLVEFYDPAEDESGQYDYDDLRRPRLTLRQLHKLRMAKDAKMVDDAQYKAFLPTMYNPPSEEGGETL